ncbi:TPA: antitermination protein N [Klebsiella oxytoca]
MDAQSRRRERRAAKQAEWNAANPLLVGVSAKPDNRPNLSLNRKPKSRVESAVNPVDLSWLAEYREEMERRAEAVERKNHKLWYKQPGERGITCSGRQKSRGKSIPAYFD